MTVRRALISGYGIAGASIAHWLVRAGWEVTVVERAAAVRSSGAPVDVRGDAVTALRAMGCYEEIRALSTGVSDVEFVDRAGRRVGGFAMEPSPGKGDFEIARHDLAQGLTRAATGARILWADSIVEARQDGDGVDAVLASGARLRSDVLIAADGLHSALRRMVVDPEDAVVAPLGLWIATLPCPITAGDGRTVRVYNEPGRSVAVHPAGGHPGAALMLRDRPHERLDMRDPEDQKAFLTGAFAGSGWLVPSVLEHLAGAADLYFDEVSRVRLGRWWRGRVVLIGDAASSVTIFGDGSSMAIAGAWELARALERFPEVGDAFDAYERAQRRRAEPLQRRVQFASHFLVPACGAGLAARNVFLRAIDLRRRRGPRD
ncbi:MAG TPA: FAD-dependent monooxygenase [Candidatus Dormibacteraeota bacterium]|nr:FAD-dependent monooxygenase [Candidatus Dormibacteraeota bacterium]